MSEQGIFNIAPGPRGETPVSSSDGENENPTAEAHDQSVQRSPFSREGGRSPFQREENAEAQHADSERGSEKSDGASPTPDRGDEAAAAGKSEADDAVAKGQPFQMNGFTPQTGNEVMEAAPVAAPQDDSPFIVVRDGNDDYEAAKAQLEPQQDFAAVPSHFETTAANAPGRLGSPETTPLHAQPVGADSRQQESHQASQYAPSMGRTSASSGMQQLELRAIFGVNHTLDISQILQRASNLPGVSKVAIVAEREAEALANFRQAIRGLGLGDFNQMRLNADGASVDFISEANTTLAVLFEGSYAPGVKETLIIVAREIGKLG